MVPLLEALRQCGSSSLWIDERLYPVDARTADNVLRMKALSWIAECMDAARSGVDAMAGEDYAGEAGLCGYDTAT